MGSYRVRKTIYARDQLHIHLIRSEHPLLGQSKLSHEPKACLCVFEHVVIADQLKRIEVRVDLWIGVFERRFGHIGGWESARIGRCVVRAGIITCFLNMRKVGVLYRKGERVNMVGSNGNIEC